MPQALILTLEGPCGEVVRGSNPGVIDVTIARALPKEMLRVFMRVAAPDASRAGQHISLVLPSSWPASSSSDDAQGHVLVILASLLVMAQVPLDNNHVCPTAEALAIHMLGGFRPVLGHSTLGDGAD